MAAAINQNRVTLGGKEYALVPKRNEKADDSTAEKVHNFVSSAYGTYRVMQLPGKIAAVAAETATLAGAADEVIQPIQNVAKVFNTAANGMVWGYWTWLSFELGDQVSKVASDKAECKDYIELFRQGADWTSAGCYSLSSLLPSFRSTLGNVATITDLTVDGIESYQAAEGWCRANSYLNQGVDLSKDVRKGLESEKTFQLIAGLKSVIAATAGIIGLVGLILGLILAAPVEIVPPIVLLTMGLAACLLAVGKHFFREGMASQPLSKWDMNLIAL